MKFVKGQNVRQVMPKPVEGVIDRFTFDETTGAVSVVVQNTDTDGHIHERVFSEADLEAVED